MVLYQESAKSPEQLGFYMPDSPYAKIDGDFKADKEHKKTARSAAQMENDVVAEHHVGRKWAEQLALMTNHTGAYLELHGSPTPYGGVDEDSIDPWIPMDQVEDAKDEAKAKIRVASRKLKGQELVEEKARIEAELRAKIGLSRLPRSRDKKKPVAESPA